MVSRTHDVFAFASLVTVSVYHPPYSLNLITLVFSLIANIIGSLLPDIDQATNRLWDLLPAGNSLGRVFRKLFLSHRTITHSLLGIFLVNRFFLWLLPKIFNQIINVEIVYLALMVGYISHLFLDLFTEEGLPLFFPIKTKIGFPPIAPLRIKTGKLFEKVIVFPSIIAYTIWFSYQNQGKLINILKLAVK